MSTTWDQASKCPRDGAFTGKVTSRKAVKGGQLVTLECPEDNCPYHLDGWIVQVRPDGTIPDAVVPSERERQFAPTSMSASRRRLVMDALDRQVELEMQKHGEVK